MAGVNSRRLAHMSNDPEHMERNKQKNVKGEEADGNHHAIKNAEKWNQDLASESEAYVKADRAAREAVSSVQELQQATLEALKKKSKE